MKSIDHVHLYIKRLQREVDSARLLHSRRRVSADFEPISPARLFPSLLILLARFAARLDALAKASYAQDCALQYSHARLPHHEGEALLSCSSIVAELTFNSTRLV